LHCIMNEIFYSKEIVKNEIILMDQEANHCIKVLRKKVQDMIQITDGLGHIYTTEISYIGNKKVYCSIIETSYHKKKEKMSIGVGILKNRDRMEWMVEKLVEIGIDQLFFIQSVNSERSKINTDRFEKKAISAMKQSLRTHLPKIDTISFDQIFNLSFDKKYIAHCEEGNKTFWGEKTSKLDESTLLLIGPEGDFSTKEIELCLSNDFLPVTLGDFRLRTETAAIYSLAKFQSI